MKISIILSCFFLTTLPLEGLEIRAIIDSKEDMQTLMVKKKFYPRGDYSFTDHIYSDNDHPLNDEFVRIREYQKSSLPVKKVVIVHKIRDPIEGNHQILFKEEGQTIDEIEQFIPENFTKRFSFSRNGSEYFFEGMNIYVEEIDGLPPSLEVIAPTRQEVQRLFRILKISQIISDSVPEWYSIYNKTNSIK